MTRLELRKASKKTKIKIPWPLLKHCQAKFVFLSHPVAGQGEKGADVVSLYPTTPICSESHFVHPKIPQTMSISRILSLTSTSYTFHRYIFHCLPTENAPLFLPTYPHENYTAGVNILVPFPFALLVVISIFLISSSCLWKESHVSILQDLAGILPAFPTTLRTATPSPLKIKLRDQV